MTRNRFCVYCLEEGGRFQTYGLNAPGHTDEWAEEKMQAMGVHTYWLVEADKFETTDGIRECYDDRINPTKKLKSVESLLKEAISITSKKGKTYER